MKSPILRRTNTVSMDSKASPSRFKLRKPRTCEYLIYTARCLPLKNKWQIMHIRPSLQLFNRTSCLHSISLTASNQIISRDSRNRNTLHSTLLSYLSLLVRLGLKIISIQCLLLNNQTSQNYNFNNPRQTFRFHIINKNINSERKTILNKEKGRWRKIHNGNMDNRYTNNRGPLSSHMFIRSSILTMTRKFP